MAYQTRPQQPQQQQGPPPDCFLRLNHDFPPQASYNQEVAVKTLLRLPQVSATVPYSFVHIDKPGEGETHVIFLLPNQPKLPPDGIRYLEEEQRYAMNIAPGIDLEVMESKSGFVPGGIDSMAWRVRRIFRLTKGGHSSMAILHYSKGHPTPIPPHFINQPIRNYPLREVNEPALFVAGEKMGQKLFPQQQAIISVASQNNTMGQMERRREKERREAPPPAPLPNEDDDDVYVTNRSLALLRFTRNHDHLAEIFSPLSITQIPDVPSPYGETKVSDLKDKLASLLADIDALEAGKAKRENKGSATTQGDGSANSEPMAMDVSA